MKERILSWKKGQVFLFALIKRTDIEDKWDILISADWIKKNNDQTDLVEIIKILRSEFASDLDFLSKIVLLVKEEPIVTDIARAIKQYSLPEGYVGELRIDDSFTIEEINLVHIDLNNFDVSKSEIEEVREKQDF